MTLKELFQVEAYLEHHVYLLDWSEEDKEELHSEIAMWAHRLRDRLNPTLNWSEDTSAPLPQLPRNANFFEYLMKERDRLWHQVQMIDLYEEEVTEHHD